jgi:putative oxidoreductase
METLADLHQFVDLGLIVLRIALAVIFWVHGVEKWTIWKEQHSQKIPAAKIREKKILSVVEPLGAVALLAGFLTQFAAIGLAIIMVGAIRLKAVIKREPFSDPKTHKTGWEYNFILLAATVFLFLSGAGSLSIDHYLFGI